MLYDRCQRVALRDTNSNASQSRWGENTGLIQSSAQVPGIMATWDPNSVLPELYFSRRAQIHIVPMRSPDFWRLLLKCFPQPNSTLWLPICSLCASQPRREQLWCMMRSERVGASAFVFKEARWELFPKKYIGFRIWTSRDGLEGPLAILGRESKGLHAGRRQKGNGVCLGGAEYMPEGRENELQNGRSWPRLWNSLNVILGRARLYIRGNEETIRFWARDPNQMRVVLYDVSIQLEFTLNLLHARHSIRFWGCSNERSHSFIQNKQSHCSMTLNARGNRKQTQVNCELLSCVGLFATPWTIQSMEFSRPENWSGYPIPSQGIFLTQGSNSGLPHCRWILYQPSPQGSRRGLHYRSLGFRGLAVGPLLVPMIENEGLI